MQCERVRERLSALRDHELAPDERRLMEEHLASCKACAELLADFDRIGRKLVEQGRRPVPAGLQDKVLRALDGVEAMDGVGMGVGTGRPPVPLARLRALPLMRMPALAQQTAAMIAVALLSALATWWAVTSAVDSDRVEREILDAHIRSLLLDSPVQVASSDQHTVKPWFAGKTDVAPVVKDLAAEGFPLVGGRLDYVDGHRASVLVYRRRLHVINVFIWPQPGPDEPARTFSRNGYSLIGWRHGGIATWMASDLNAGEMANLAGLL